MSDGFRSQSDSVTLDLSSRQVTGVIVGSLLSLAVVFALGVSVGHRVGSAPLPGNGPASVDALDKPVPPPEPAMAFHDALRTDDPSHVPNPRVAAKPAEVEPKPAPVVPEAPVPAVAEAAKPIAAAIATPEPVKPVAVPEPVKPAPVVAKPVVAAPEAKPKPVGMNDEGADLDETWTVQFASSPARAEADRMAATLGEKGYAARVVVADLAGKGRYYRVRVGRFASRDTADNLRREASAKTGVTGVVMRSQ